MRYPDLSQHEVCAEVEYVCHVSVHCNEHVEVAIHGRGFVDHGVVGGAKALRCRLNGGMAFDATFVDKSTLTCATRYNPAQLTTFDPTDGASVSVEVSFDAGARWTRLEPQTIVNIPCHSPPALPPSTPPPPSPSPSPSS